jgi:hypothetical protein
VSIARPKTEAVLEQDAGIHAGKDGGVTAWADLQIAQIETAREDFVGG